MTSGKWMDGDTVIDSEDLIDYIDDNYYDSLINAFVADFNEMWTPFEVLEHCLGSEGVSEEFHDWLDSCVEDEDDPDWVTRHTGIVPVSESRRPKAKPKAPTSKATRPKAKAKAPARKPVAKPKAKGGRR